jgi:hypothetical protein
VETLTKNTYRIKFVTYESWRVIGKENRYCIQRLTYFIFKWFPLWTTLSGCDDMTKSEAESYMKEILATEKEFTA